MADHSVFHFSYRAIDNKENTISLHRHSSFGILKPLSIPDRPWQSISMDFVTGLPWLEGWDTIWVVVDRLTKTRHLIACRSNIDVKGLADLFLRHVFSLHGLPDSIVSDRGPQFAASFW